MEPSAAGSGVSSPVAKKPNTLAAAAGGGRGCFCMGMPRVSAVRTMTDDGTVVNGSGRIEWHRWGVGPLSLLYARTWSSSRPPAAALAGEAAAGGTKPPSPPSKSAMVGCLVVMV